MNWSLLARLAARDGGWLCHYCGRPLPHVQRSGRPAGLKLRRGSWQLLDGWEWPTADHMVPKSLGGPDAIWNRVLACEPCNRAKGVQSYEDFVETVRPWGLWSQALIAAGRTA